MSQLAFVGIKAAIHNTTTNKFLVLNKESDHLGRHLDLPGGKLEVGEIVEDCLKRELKEEVPSIGEYEVGHVLAVHNAEVKFPDGNGLFLVFYYVSVKSLDVTLSNEHFGYQWINKKDLETTDLKVYGGLRKALTAGFDYIEKL